MVAKGGKGVPVGGFMSWLWWLAVVLVCTGTLEMHVRAGPIYVAVGTCPNSSSGGILDVDEHGFLYSSGLIVNFFVHNVELVGVQRVS